MLLEARTESHATEHTYTVLLIVHDDLFERNMSAGPP